MSYALPTVTYLMNETALNVLLALTFQLTSIERPFNASSRIAGASYGHHHGDEPYGNHAIFAPPHTKTRAYISTTVFAAGRCWRVGSAYQRKRHTN